MKSIDISQNNNFRVRFFCDTNNNFFTLARFLRREGIDAKVVPNLSISRKVLYRIYDAIRDPDDYHCLELVNIQDSLVLENPFEYQISRVREALLGFLGGDRRVISVGSSFAPAMFEYAGLRLDITFPTGADVRYLPFFRSVNSISRGFGTSLKKNITKYVKENSNLKSRADFMRLRSWNSPHFWLTLAPQIRHEYQKFKKLPQFQYDGIRSSLVALQDDMYVDTWAIKNNLRLRTLTIPMEDNRNKIPGSFKGVGAGMFSATAIKLRSRYNFIVLSTNQNTPAKGTDILLRGYLRFKYQNPNINSLLIVSARPDLTWMSRGVEKNFNEGLSRGEIFLLPLLPQKELDDFYNISDVVFGKINDDNYYLNSTISKGLAHGKPMLNFINAEYKKKITNLYPYVSTKDDDEVANELGRLFGNRDFLNELGSHAFDWYQNFVRFSTMNWISTFQEIAKVG